MSTLRCAMATPASCWYRRASSDMTIVLPPPVGSTPMTLGWPCLQAVSIPAIRLDWYPLSTVTPLVVDGNDFGCIVAAVPQVRNHQPQEETHERLLPWLLRCAVPDGRRQGTGAERDQ